ncbi:hypothetical protein FIU87_03865 [Bacillus sp. THAF10]|nr:hypothetical protein FIU87_03865 [Bacillus sp. THAF10]
MDEDRTGERCPVRFFGDFLSGLRVSKYTRWCRMAFILVDLDRKMKKWLNYLKSGLINEKLDRKTRKVA